MEMKYGARHGECEQPCPPAASKPREGDAFRFTRATPSTADFVPVGIMRPRVGDSCSALGLSFFTTLAFARDRYKALAKKGANIAARVGTHIATVSISAADGLATPPSSSGHFDLHEAASATLERNIRGLVLA
jgi:hypothetical protein